MKTMEEERYQVCQGHPERERIFYLEKMLIEANYPYFFNFWEDLRPVFGGGEDGDPERDIDWDSYDFRIEIGLPAGNGLSQISVCFNSEGDQTLLELLDMRIAGDKDNPTVSDGAIYTDLTATGAMEIIEKFFNGAE